VGQKLKTMNQNRIQINGMWYIREDLSENKDIEVSYSMSCLYESDDYCWEATRLMKDDEVSYYPGIDIKFTDKREKPWKEEHWDGNGWMVAVMKNGPDAVKSARESMCEQGVKDFKLFLNKLKEIKWLQQ